MMKRRLSYIGVAVGLIALLATSAFANSDIVRLRLNTAWRYVTMGWFEEAKEHATEAVDAAPLDGEARMFLALLQDVQGEREAALRQYDLAKQVEPDMAVLAVFMGDIHFEEGRLDDSVALYNEALAVDPELGLAHYGLGRVLEQRKDVEGARAAYERGVEAAPDMTDMRYRLGTMLRRDGQFDSALEHLLHANIIDSELVHVRYELGLTYEALSRFSAAEHEYRSVLRIDPDHDEARSRLAALPPT